MTATSTTESKSPESTSRRRPGDQTGLPHECDVVVVGGGAAGLAAAVTAAHQGLSVVLLERAERIGGASARSGGWIWAPGNPLARADGVVEDGRGVRDYLAAVLGDRYDVERMEAFLTMAPRMVEFFTTHTRLQFVAGKKIHDIYGDLPGAGTGHRSVAPKPLRGTTLPKRLRRILARQYYPTSFIGAGVMAGEDLNRFMTAMRHPSSFWYATRRTLRHLFDLVCHGQGMHWVNGLALVARLLHSADDAGVEVRTGHEVIELLTEESARAVAAADRVDDVVPGAEPDGSTGPSRVLGVRVRSAQGEREVRARRGVVLASGGFPADPELRAATFGRERARDEHWTLAPDTCDGAGLRLAEPHGGHLDTSVAQAAAYCPVSLVPPQPRRTRRAMVFPHIADRAKPGVIGVLRNGRRFVNEANGYHDYVTAMLANTPVDEVAESWLIGDQRVVRSYPFGFAKPRPIPLWPYRACGYLVSAPTIRELAISCGIDPDGLEGTIARFNTAALRGEDPDFGRGRTPFNRYGGDPAIGPNPSLAPVERGPFHAVRVVPGSFGTFAGLTVDARARVLTEQGAIVPGLRAVGNDQSSVMRGFYPAGGINLGPALTFGHLVGLDLADRLDLDPGSGLGATKTTTTTLEDVR